MPASFPAGPIPTNPHPFQPMYLSELKALHISRLIEIAQSLEIEAANRLRKQELMFAILKRKARNGDQIFGDGVLEVLPDGFGFLRTPETSYLASPDDIYISPSQIRRFNLHTGDSIEGEVRTPKDGERYFALVKVGDAAGINDQLLRAGIIVRPVANYGLPEWLRVSVGLPEENRAFIDALTKILGQ